MIAYFEHSLAAHLGEGARKPFSELGLSDTDFRQLPSAGGMVSFIRITGGFDTAKCTRVMTEAEANARIAELFTPEYLVTNETIFNASLNQKVASGAADLDLMPESGYLEWLHGLGVKGIAPSAAPAPFAAE